MRAANHRQLLLVMPRAFVVEFTLEHRDSNDVMRWIKRLIGHLEDDPDQEIRNVLIQICRWEAKTSYEGRGEGFIACVIDACTALKDAELLHVVI